MENGRVSNPCPYLCQYDNALHPEGSCNMTSLGMVLIAHKLDGKVPGERINVADRLLQYCDDHNLDRHDLGVIRDLAVKFGLQDDASYSHTFDEIKAHLRAGGLVIVQGMFTKSGHVIVFCGYDPGRGTWICNDPAGNHNIGYGHGGGDHVEYSSVWIHNCAAPDGDGKVWAHLIAAA